MFARWMLIDFVEIPFLSNFRAINSTKGTIRGSFVGKKGRGEVPNVYIGQQLVRRAPIGDSLVNADLPICSLNSGWAVLNEHLQSS